MYCQTLVQRLQYCKWKSSFYTEFFDFIFEQTGAIAFPHKCWIIILMSTLFSKMLGAENTQFVGFAPLTLEVIFHW